MSGGNILVWNEKGIPYNDLLLIVLQLLALFRRASSKLRKTSGLDSLSPSPSAGIRLTSRT